MQAPGRGLIPTTFFSIQTSKSQGNYPLFKLSPFQIGRLQGKRKSVIPTSVNDHYRDNLPFYPQHTPQPQIKLRFPAPRTTTPPQHAPIGDTFATQPRTPILYASVPRDPAIFPHLGEKEEKKSIVCSMEQQGSLSSYKMPLCAEIRLNGFVERQAMNSNRLSGHDRVH